MKSSKLKWIELLTSNKDVKTETITHWIEVIEDQGWMNEMRQIKDWNCWLGLCLFGLVS